MSNMFASWEKTINPLAGACQHGCGYCWVPRVAASKPAMKAKYTGPPRLVESELARIRRANGRVFVGSCTDLFGAWVPSEMIQRVLDAVAMSCAEVLLCTKNPARYQDFDLPYGVVAGATIETDQGSSELYPTAKAPGRLSRSEAMMDLEHPRKMISVEPVMSFTDWLRQSIEAIKPEFVFVGYDNYECGLPEPSLAETMALIGELRAAGITVYGKTLREPVGDGFKSRDRENKEDVKEP